MASSTKSSFWDRRRVLITGGTGLLGAHLTRRLVDSGADVVALVRDWLPRSLFFSKAAGWSLIDKVSIVRGEVEDFGLLERTVNEYEIDSIFHLAAQTLVGNANRSPIATFKANIEGTWNVLEAARMHSKLVQRIVIASSDKAYGNLEGHSYTENFPLRGEHPYDVSKSCADLISRTYFVTYGQPVAVTRCGNFYGPGDLNFSRIVPGTILSALRNEPVLIRSNGKFIRDYIFADDGAHAYLTLAEKMVPGDGGQTPFAGEAFNFSYGLRLSVLELVQTILKLMGREDLQPKILNEASHEIPVQCLDSTKAKEQLNWKPLHGFEAGLRETIEWYKHAFRN